MRSHFDGYYIHVRFEIKTDEPPEYELRNIVPRILDIAEENLRTPVWGTIDIQTSDTIYDVTPFGGEPISISFRTVDVSIQTVPTKGVE